MFAAHSGGAAQPAMPDLGLTVVTTSQPTGRRAALAVGDGPDRDGDRRWSSMETMLSVIGLGLVLLVNLML